MRMRRGKERKLHGKLSGDGSSFDRDKIRTEHDSKFTEEISTTEASFPVRLYFLFDCRVLRRVRTGSVFVSLALPYAIDNNGYR